MNATKYMFLALGVSTCGGQASRPIDDNRQAVEDETQADSGAEPVVVPSTGMTETEAPVELDLDTCNELKKFPGEVLYEAMHSNPMCDSDADCATKITLSTDVCVANRCGTYSGSSNYRAALEEAFDDPEVSARCDELVAGNCFRFPASCPPPPSEPRTYTCVEGACVAQ